jgi:hypothetical protein
MGMKGQPQAGLAALAQPAQAPKGMPSGNMQQIMARAKSMSDAQLADILAGKSMDVPQYVAMTEAMGRKSLRNAVQGQQAMQQAKQPTIKDKLLNEYKQEQMAQAAPQMGGISGIPAPNMESVDMASGGIIAFAKGDVVEDEETEKSYFAKMKEKLRKATESSTTAPSMPSLMGIPLFGAADKNALAKDAVVPTASTAELPPASTGAQPDSLGRFVAGAEAPPAPVAASKVTGVGSAAGEQPFSIPSYESLQKNKSQDYLQKLEGLTEKQRAGIADIKKQGGGEALMALAKGVLSKPTLAQGLAEGTPGVIEASRSTRNQILSQSNLANEYDLNLAKAREAAEKGDMALALQYTQLANQAKAQGDTAAYQQGMLGIHQGRNAIMGEGAQLGKVQLGLANADKQALNEAKLKFPMITKSNQAAFDAFVKKRSMELKMQNPLTKPYASLGGGDLGSSRFNTVQSLPKGASVIDLES